MIEPTLIEVTGDDPPPRFIFDRDGDEHALLDLRSLAVMVRHLGEKGMKITIDSVNKDGAASSWGYTTNFDGKDEPLHGNQGVDTGSVRMINSKINEIIYKQGGKVVQVLTNILSPDNTTIGVTYMRMKDGKTTGVTFATYEKMK